MLNYGCIEICKNMLASAQRVGIPQDDLYIACLDDRTYNELISFKNAFLYKNQEITDYQNWTYDENSNFRKIVSNKWPIIASIYNDHKQLCWVDTDVVFVKNPTHILSNRLRVLFQSGTPWIDICSGFMVFNDTEVCSQIITECALDDTADDQLIINDISKKYKEYIEILPNAFFPNGYVFYTQGIKNNAYIVHNTHMVGVDTKINAFKSENLWYL